MAPKGPYVACGRVIIFATLEQQQPNFKGLAQIGSFLIKENPAALNLLL